MMIGYLLVIVVSLLTCGGQLCQKQAALCWQLPPDVRRGPTLRWLALAVLLLGAGMAVWLNVLQRLPLSLAYPMLSLNFVLVTLAARWLFQEPTTLRHWCGVASIMLGILLMSLQP
ncbi:4-amino-4-deoxy-L-arabinose-phosphoundecaprenol flippase subunit ArnE [Serratia sp. root2]|uniref:4-amino-4-deoxy-L-arabinose-phosphoundecaprenol flippase subunit ArnE n=1 Tax=Serratia sp. root2 TaxID=3059676 RepID=UPI0028901A65|nr:4-amino-4-deoxy-L-arabinose-phosphoundecaprenol flippase subunit ArnE [Serratia sp. root2]MDT3250742.1 4-amino-4-deoxy-L-arabinose-phosphoundecaprenol flippase subunit ArnE [Serratia sp. root2]